MKTLPLDAVRNHTGRQLSVAEARPLVANANLSILRAQAAALSLHSWNNTSEDWLRLEACLVLIEERRRRGH